jgi:hypothetical protein
MGSQRVFGLVAAAALAAALLGACADDPPDPGGTPDPAPPTVSPTPPVTPPATPHPPMPRPSPPVGAEQTITGEVVPGVEAGCILLRTERDEFLLVSGDEDLAIGQRVTIRGYLDPDLPTICQQGTPFVVLEVESS